LFYQTHPVLRVARTSFQCSAKIDGLFEILVDLVSRKRARLLSPCGILPSLPSADCPLPTVLPLTKTRCLPIFRRHFGGPLQDDMGELSMPFNSHACTI
jgi:hypothetical protein